MSVRQIEMNGLQAEKVRLVTNGVRRLTILIVILSVVVSPILYLFPDRTDTLFAWTIMPPLTAAFLGASYGTALIIEIIAAMERVWVRARVAYPAMFTFATLILIATIIHLDKFHFASPGMAARGTAWAWFILYIITPPLMLVLLIFQLRRPGVDPARENIIPRWFRLLLAIESIAMIAIGLVLFIIPQSANGFWPWMLTPLAGRAVGAWLVGLGIAAGQSILEGAWERVKIALAGNIIFALLQLILVVRFSGSIQWSLPGASLYLVFLLYILALGMYGLYTARLATQRSIKLLPV